MDNVYNIVPMYIWPGIILLYIRYWGHENAYIYSPTRNSIICKNYDR